jgi:hypothetical protein
MTIGRVVSPLVAKASGPDEVPRRCRYVLCSASVWSAPDPQAAIIGDHSCKRIEPGRAAVAPRRARLKIQRYTRQPGDVLCHVSVLCLGAIRSDSRAAAPPLTKPAVCVIRSRIVMSRFAGTSVTSDAVPTVCVDVFCPFGIAIFVSLNCGMNLDTGSLRRIRPSSTSIRIATAVTGFVIDAMRKMASLRIGVLDSMSIRPWASKWAMRPRLATRATAPAIFFASM